jgi:hypothetical protein
MRTSRTQAAKAEVGEAGDRVLEAGEGSVRGITSGGNKIITT